MSDDEIMSKKILLWLSVIALSCILLSGCLEEGTIDDKNSQFNPDGNLVVIEGKEKYNHIQEAIDAASDGDTIFVYNGIYIETIVLNKSINLVGETMAKPTITYGESIGENMAIIWITADNCTVNGFNIVYNITSPYEPAGIRTNSSNNIISNNTIMNITYGVYADRGSKNNLIEWNNILNNKYSIYLTSTSHSNVTWNTILNTSKYGIYLDHAYTNTISWNNISDGFYGIRLKGTTGNQIFRNILADNQYGMFFCCGAKVNTMFHNTFMRNDEANAVDALDNQWDNGNAGNYWDDYTEKYPTAIQQGDVWDTPYKISQGENIDRFPLVNPIQT